MVVENSKLSGWEIMKSFFPFQLLKAHLKHNLLALFYWAFLFSIVSDSIGSKFGVPILFYSPEYMGNVSNWSFLFLGFGIGGFTMGFNTYSYIRLGAHFTFLATLNQPFYKFCINNSLIPLVFNLFFMWSFSAYQMNEEFASFWSILNYNIAYLIGFVLFQLLSVLYFFPMNQRINRSILDPMKDRDRESIVKTVIPNKGNFNDKIRSGNDGTFIYLGKNFRFQSSRSGSHYSKDLLNQIYRKNKVNATLFETLALISFLTLGLFSNFTYFEVPAAVSIVLLLTIVLMLFSALLSWLHRWAYPILLLVFIAMNYLSLNSPFFTFKNYAYGLSYQTKTPYSIEQIKKTTNTEATTQSSFATIVSILDNWKKKTGKKKPKLVLINVSGGGSRSATWALTCLSNLDHELNNSMSRHTHLITGASGGMIGAAYYREIQKRFGEKNISNPFDPIYQRNISSDLLNKLSFAASTNDIFFRYQTFKVGEHAYPKDRGRAFEQELHENTANFLTGSLSKYEKGELNAEIPIMIFSPTIVNDGRRLLIASQSLQFLTKNQKSKNGLTNSYENIDYLSFFKNHSPEKIEFASVLRASATFPFVMPMVTMPTRPEVQLMDAGIRDNYGGKVTMEYVFALKTWIEKNTSGVIIVQIRDTKKMLDNETYQEVSLFRKFTLPFGNMYSNFTRTQDFDQEQLIKIGASELNFPVDVVSFNLRENKNDKISLSWHLSKQEKLKIDRAFKSQRNQASLKKMKKLLNE